MQTEIQTTRRGQEMVQDKQLGHGRNVVWNFEERAWRKKLAVFFQQKLESIYLNRQSHETAFLVDYRASMHMMSKTDMAPEDDYDHGQWVDRLNRGGHSLRGRFGHVSHGPTSGRHSIGFVSGKTLRRKWVWKRRPKPQMCQEWQDGTLDLR